MSDENNNEEGFSGLVVQGLGFTPTNLILNTDGETVDTGMNAADAEIQSQKERPEEA